MGGGGGGGLWTDQGLYLSLLLFVCFNIMRTGVYAQTRKGITFQLPATRANVRVTKVKGARHRTPSVSFYYRLDQTIDLTHMYTHKDPDRAYPNPVCVSRTNQKQANVTMHKKGQDNGDGE